MRGTRDPEAPEKEVIRRLENLESRVAMIEEHAVHNTRLKGDDHKQFLKKVFGASKRRAQVYLAANGKRSVSGIAGHLTMKQQNVTIELQTLQASGLVAFSTSGATNLWTKSQLDSVIGASQTLMKQFNLTKDGIPRG